MGRRPSPRGPDGSRGNTIRHLARRTRTRPLGHGGPTDTTRIGQIGKETATNDSESPQKTNKHQNKEDGAVGAHLQSNSAAPPRDDFTNIRK
ncbi:hypothetical protein EYF80_050935 [Liparis tanakae]|uniref:Uncharacterized protein n=1 Tax=Liparis tanakae TaxID=230148 RepID=A0A4Z2FDE7_9TELE|nr:hypothetical protein EYF80_050935 [Liparis tanakae]